MVWVMHQIIKLGKDVSIDMLPRDLDSKSKQFLIKTISLDKENQEMKDQFKGFKKTLLTA